MERMTAISGSHTTGHMPAAARWNSRLPGTYTFTRSLWTRKARSKEISRRSSTGNMRKAWNWGGDQDRWVKRTGTTASACGEMTQRATGVDLEAALDSTTNITVAGPRSQGLP